MKRGKSRVKHAANRNSRKEEKPCNWIHVAVLGTNLPNPKANTPRDNWRQELWTRSPDHRIASRTDASSWIKSCTLATMPKLLEYLWVLSFSFFSLSLSLSLWLLWKKLQGKTVRQSEIQWEMSQDPLERMEHVITSSNTGRQKVGKKKRKTNRRHLLITSDFQLSHLALCLDLFYDLFLFFAFILVLTSFT